MPTAREDDHLIFSHKLSSSDYVCFYAASDNNVSVLIHPNTYSKYTLEAYIIDEYIFDTIRIMLWRKWNKKW